MCGFTGFLGGRPASRTDRAALLAAMGERIRHRGPDSADVWCDTAAPFGVAHRLVESEDEDQRDP